MARVLINADPDGKAEIFRQPGLRLTHHPGTELVTASSGRRPLACSGVAAALFEYASLLRERGVRRERAPRPVPHAVRLTPRSPATGCQRVL